MWRSNAQLSRAFAACAAAISLMGAGPATGVPVNIDVILPLTGGQAFSGHIHEETIHVYERYANANGGINGRPIHFDIHDDRSEERRGGKEGRSRWFAH